MSNIIVFLWYTIHDNIAEHLKINISELCILAIYHVYALPNYLYILTVTQNRKIIVLNTTF